MRDFRSLEQKIRQVWLDEAEARNTAARKKVENVGRPQDSVKDPETSKLAKQGEIKTKIIDEVTLDIGPNTGPNEEAEDNQKEKDPRKITGGKTEVILDPKTDDRPEEQSMEDEKQKKTVKQENKKIGTKSGVKEETMTKLTFGLPDSLIDTVRQVVEAKKMVKVCPKCGKSPCQCESMKEELKGGQKNLDKNHNGRLDAEDFKILRGEKKGMKEEVSFSDAELAHIESIMGEAKEYNTPVDKDMGPLNVAAQIRKGKDVGGHVEITHPHTGKTHKIPVKVANKFNADYASAEKPAHKEKIEQDFVKQHMS